LFRFFLLGIFGALWFCRMTKEEFSFLFRAECRQHKIADVELVFLGESKSTLAIAKGHDSCLWIFDGALSLSYQNTIELIRHELAHILDFRDGGWKRKGSRWDIHGANWKKFCAILGCKARTSIPRVG